MKIEIKDNERPEFIIMMSRAIMMRYGTFHNPQRCDEHPLCQIWKRLFEEAQPYYFSVDNGEIIKVYCEICEMVKQFQLKYKHHNIRDLDILECLRCDHQINRMDVENLERFTNEYQ